MISALIASLLVTFPAENQKLPATGQTYVIGAAGTNRKERLYLNGVGIDVYRTGAFLAFAKTRPGTNVLEFAQGTNTLVRRFVVVEPARQLSTASGKPQKPRNPYEDLGIPADAEFAAKPPKGTSPRTVHVMVDAGHGGNDPGALSPRGFKEKDFNLEQALSLETEGDGLSWESPMSLTNAIANAVRKEDEIIYGDMSEDSYVYMIIMGETETENGPMPNNIMVQLCDSKTKVPKKQKMVKGLKEAFEFADAWLTFK